MRIVFWAACAWLVTCLPARHARQLLKYTIQPSQKPLADLRVRQLLVDVSVIVKSDAKTGIQRVVRALLLELLINPPEGHVVRPVFAGQETGYKYVPKGFGLPDFTMPAYKENERVVTSPGDHFLGLDLCANLLPKQHSQLLQWRLDQVKIHIVVYDALPIFHPKWFNAKTGRNFKRWFKTMAFFADEIICISNVVRGDIQRYLKDKFLLTQDCIPVRVIQLGADFASSMPTRGLPNNANALLANFKERPTALMVGTLEPRKGHSEILEAFEQLWRQGSNFNLVFAGKSGWKTGSLQLRLLSHTQQNKHLYWLSDVTDEWLETLYQSCTGVIAASLGEGFGLPVIEAANFRKPVLARDIPVFREIAGPSVSFFPSKNGESLAETIDNWLSLSQATPTDSSQLSLTTWHESGKQLLQCMGLVGTHAPSHPVAPKSVVGFEWS